MAVYRLGDMIRMRREALGMTQEELIQAYNRKEEGQNRCPQLSVPRTAAHKEKADEICSIQTLRRAENGGVARVKIGVYRRLMQKMGVLPERIYTSVLVTKSRALRLKTEIHAHINQGEYETAETKLEALEAMLVPGYPRNEQYRIAVRAKIAYKKKELGAEEYLAALQKALRFTVPMLDEIDIAKWPFNMNEFDILLETSNAYRSMKQLEKQKNFLLKLKKNVERGYMDGAHYVVWHMFTLVGLSQCMCIEAQHDKSQEYCQVGIEECRTHRILGSVYRFLYDVAWNRENQIRMNSGLKEEPTAEQESAIKKERVFCKKQLVQAYYLSVAQNDLHEAARIKLLYEHLYPNATKLLE